MSDSEKTSPTSMRIALAGILSLGALALLIVSMKLAPRFVSVYKETGIPLPGVTLALLSLCSFCSSFWYLIVAAWGISSAMALMGAFDRIALPLIIVMVMALVLLVALFVIGFFHPLSGGLLQGVRRNR